MGAPRAGPTGYPSSYAAGSAAGTSVPVGHYNVPPAPQTMNQNIPAALAAIPENQRVSQSLACRRITLKVRTGSCSKTGQHETGGYCYATSDRTRERNTTGASGRITVCGLLFSPDRDDPAHVVGHPLVLPRCRPRLLSLTCHLSRPTCIPELYKYPPASLQRPLWLATLTWLEIFPDRVLSMSQRFRGSGLTLNNSVYASVHSR